MGNVIVLTWIAQIILFFICWRALLWGTRAAKQYVNASSLWVDLVVNLVLAILLLIVIHTVHSTWWLMVLVGAFVGVFSGQMLQKRAD